MVATALVEDPRYTDDMHRSRPSCREPRWVEPVGSELAQDWAGFGLYTERWSRGAPRSRRTLPISCSIQWRGLNGSRKPYTAATQTCSRHAGTIVVAPVRPRGDLPRALLRQRSGQVDLNEAVHRKLLHGGVGSVARIDRRDNSVLT